MEIYYKWVKTIDFGYVRSGGETVSINEKESKKLK